MEGTIRLARPDDAAAILEIYRPFVSDSHVSFEIVVPSENEIRDRIRETLELAPWLVHEIDCEVAGYAYAGTFRDRAAYRWAVETSVYVLAERRRCGIARALMAVLLESLTAQGFRRAYAGIALPNDASVTLFEALGFRRAGLLPAVGFKLGRWWDVGLWERTLPSGTDPPAETLSLTEIGLTEAWRRAPLDAQTGRGDTARRIPTTRTP